MATAQKTRTKVPKISPMILVSHKRKIKPWGMSSSIDLHDCDHNRLTSKKLLREFVLEIIKVVEMEAHGPCHIDRFGSGNLEGYSAIQFIETSSITVHLDEKWDRAFIDIFSCKDFDTDKALQFCKNYFGAKKSKMTVLDR
ncbi:MAG TPA: S-adenosylmethionine decarboxylase [Candidatus Andersenbacteria bacterium]|nr:S-adenosylmethionine decarboxylase [Candidatus Andersenbacteria bacterium]